MNLMKFIKRNWLLIYTLGGIAIGIIIGLINNYYWSTSWLQRYYWGYPGTVLLMNMLKCIIIPLITLSITTGVASMSETRTKMMGWAVGYYLLTTILAIINGIIFAVIVKPGQRQTTAIRTNTTYNVNAREQSVADGLLDIVRNCFPPNIVHAMIQQATSARTGLATDPGGQRVSITYGGSQNTLGLIVFCCFFGYYLGKLAGKGNKEAKSALNLFNGCNDAIMKMVDLIMIYHPIGLLFLISKKIMDMGPDMAETWKALGYHILTTLICIVIHFFIVLPLIYYFTTRKNPFVYLGYVAQAVATAFASASSAATLPITIRNNETKAKIDPRVTRFMLPLGATINMDGTALYEAISCIFIANLNDVYMNFGHIVTIAVTATAASIGAAAVPSAGLITLLIVLGSVGLEEYAGDIGIIYTIDWFLDRCRTATNVWGDSIGCGVVSHICADELQKNAPAYVHNVDDENEISV